ncbi:MAG: hypothetical protein Q8L57_02030 [bacterium]|nr:hypothetical protein [bacterium]
MEKFMEKSGIIPQKEKTACRICGGDHATHVCRERVDVEAKRKEYVEKLKKGEPDVVELMKEVQRKGFKDVETKKKEVREELLEGRPKEIEERKEAIREGKSLIEKKD